MEDSRNPMNLRQDLPQSVLDDAVNDDSTFEEMYTKIGIARKIWAQRSLDVMKTAN